MNNNKIYYDAVLDGLQNVYNDENVYKVGELLAKAFIDKKKIYTFGTGHSHMLGEELYVRAGGWNYIIPMLLDEITLSSHPWKSTYIERVEGFADVMLGMFPLSKGDIIIITSNSGRNGLIVEMAIRAKKIGAIVVGVTSIQHAKKVSSRHSSGKLLMDISDIVLDNFAPSGDTILTIGNQKVAPTSTMTNVFLAHQFVITALDILASKGIKFDTFISSNLDGQDERNEKLL